MQSNLHTTLEEATGEIRYNMTNDYMFRYVLEKNEKVLRGLISSLLHLKLEEIRTIQITNPIISSEDNAGKEFILDINIELNNDTKINLEMQMHNQNNWPDRSLSYLCRSFDQLYRGSKYEEAFPVIHIGFLNFTLFPDYPEFYASHMLLNVKNHHLFSSKIRISVVDLTRIDLATDEDKVHAIDYWARIFKAKTWEEIKMLAKDNESMKEAVNSIFMANADDIVRQKCLAREDAERHERTLQRDMKILKDENAELKGENTELKGEVAELKDELAELKKRIAYLEAQKD